MINANFYARLEMLHFSENLFEILFIINEVFCIIIKDKHNHFNLIKILDYFENQRIKHDF